MKEERKYVDKLNKQLKGLQLRSPIFFSYEVSYIHRNVNILMNWDSTSRSYDIDFNEESKELVRRIYLDLFKNYYPKMKRNDGKIFVVDKINLKTNEIIVKPEIDPNTFDVHAVQLKVPCFIFVKNFCRKNTVNEEERWNKFVEYIDKIKVGDDIYHEI